ncbi:hypothetical protein ACTAZI_10150 [Legionella bozemanae]|uniref:hypothetical protein n=1 Tax=Legionella bozemanae TaxID=447 RepID=UPI003EE89304
MTKFFDTKTKTLFVTGGRTPVADLSDNPLMELPNPDEVLPALVLRRQNAGAGKNAEKTYVSTAGEKLHGNYDLNDPSNADLEEVRDTIYCP